VNRKERELEREINLAKDEWSKEVAENIAKELHDNINQMLAIIRLQISNLEGKLKESNHLDVITKVKQEISLTIESVRSISRLLSQDNLDKFDFENAINNQKESIELSTEIKFKLIYEAKPSDFISKPSQIALYRIIQEFLHNSIKYSDCAEIELSFIRVNGDLHISMKDNGKGFNAESTKTGLGINHIMKRAEAIGASFNLETSPGLGTKMLLSLPAVNQN
jgi:signal transduction histidine kinase